MNPLLNFAKSSLLVFLLCLAFPLLAAAQTETESSSQSEGSEVNEQGGVSTRADQGEQTEQQIAGAMEDVHESLEILQDMRDDSELRALLDEAEGIFIVPDYATAALIIGAAGGGGVLFVKEDGEWGNPALYDVGSLSAGIQAGVAAGSIAMVLLSEQAVDSFRSDTNFSLTADAGFSVVDWSSRARGELGGGSDVVVWTDTEGLFAELAIGINNIIWDDEENERYYGREVSPESILDGEVANPHKHLVQQALREQ